MSKKWIISILAVGVLGVAAFFGVSAYHQVNAQATTPTPNASAAPGFGKGMGREFMGANHQQDLATALGITLDKLQAAEKSASAEALKQAVSKGLITQAQADLMSARGFGFGGKMFAANGIDYNALLASALGIDVTKLQAAYATAYNAEVDLALKNGSITQQQADLMKGRYALENDTKFQSSMQSAYKAAVQQAVTDGVITQAQADQILASNNGMDGFHGFFGGFGGRGMGGPGFGGRHGGNFNNGTNNNGGTNPSPAAPTTVPSGSSF